MRNVWQGQRRGKGSGILAFLMRFCTRCNLSPLRAKSRFEEDIWEVNDEALWGTSLLSTTFIVAMVSASVELILTAASIWMKSAMTKSRESSLHSSHCRH